MRMPYCASALAVAGLLAATPQTKIALPSGGSLSYSSQKSETRLEIHTESGRHYEVRVQRDATIEPGAAPDNVQLVGEVPGKALIVTDTYPSAPLGMNYCQAGEEQFLRVITLAAEKASETLDLKLASCRDNIELADPGLEWNAPSRTLRIHWLEGPANKQAAEERTIHISAGGKPD
jgi:hypothetical protein